MGLPWSISTTVRNPERLRDFLNVLSQIEGEEFNPENQIRYQILLIKERFYKPTKIPLKYKRLFEDITAEIPFEIAREVFEYQEYKDPPMRGRQSVNPLNKLGFSIARERAGKIKLTELGKQFILPDCDISYIFFKSLLKLQFPNPWSDDFSEKKGFNIKPFIATLKLMKETQGLSRTEFALFVPTLINCPDIDKYAKYILELRKKKSKEDKEKFIDKFLENFYQTKSLTKIQINNLFDYGDNAMRYFRLTKYFRVIKKPLGNWVIDLEPSRLEEIKQLLAMYDGSAYKFKTVEDYIAYLSDINQPQLPWEADRSKLKNIAISLVKILHEDFSKLNDTLKIQFEIKYKELVKSDIDRMQAMEMQCLINKMRQFRFMINQISVNIGLKKNLEELKKIITVLKDKKSIRDLEPAEFEYIIFKALKILNDEIDIKPNCLFDDNGNPIGFAPGNRADIESYYQTFNAVFEVTLDVSRNQVYRESMPVMRHLRDFENMNSNKPCYCVFIAPKVHTDTVEYFWNSIKYGFQGQKQKIVALDLEQFTKLLENFLVIVENNRPFTHQELRKLLEIIVLDAEQRQSSINWLENTSSNVVRWEESLE